MSGGAKIAADAFYKRLDVLLKLFQKDEGSSGLFKGAVHLVFLFGRVNDDLPYSKTSAFFRWAVGYDLTDTLVLIDKRGAGKVTFLVSSSKEQFLRSGLIPAPGGLDLQGRQPVEVEILVRSKNTGGGPGASEKQDLDRLVARLKAGTVGGVWNHQQNGGQKEPHQGAFAESVLEALHDETEGLKLVDVDEAMAEVFLRKDMKDVNAIKSSCSISDVVLKKFIIPRLEEEATGGKKVSPNKLSDYIAGYFRAPEKISQKLQPQFVEACYNPIFSSGPFINPDLTKFENSSNPLEYSVIVMSVGSKYKSLCSNVMRTVLINPTEKVTAAYESAVAAFKAATDSIKPGASLAEPFNRARRVLQERDLSLAEQMDPCIGHSIGHEFHESILLTADSNGKFEHGMAFNLMLLIQGCNEGRSVIGLADTVLVTADGCEVLTKATKEGLQYDLEEKQGSSEGEDAAAKEEKVEDGGKRKSRMRDQVAMTSETELKERQRENFLRLQREMEKRAEIGSSSNNAASGEATAKDWLKLDSYPKGANSFPNEAAPYRLVVDQENETVLMPINGYVVPIHVSLIKNVTKLDDTIRFQMHVPGKGKMSLPANTIMEEQPNTVWIKEVVYHLPNSNLLASIDRSIKEMRKRVAAQEKRKADLAGLMEQDALVLAREKPPQLLNVFVRPSLAGKRVVGTLEAHKNGFRYTTGKGQKLDVLYNNIAHAFFQPAEQEALVILHFNLHHPIVIGKKKTQDVQFVQETMEASSRLDARRRNYGDADEIEEEQREKVARKKINRTFFKFCKDVEEFAKKSDPDGEDVIKFDYPSRELGFMGVPFKSNVLLQPTAQDCLVHLVEGPPFFVLSLDDVEVASFERVMFGLRQFDLVFVLKDYSKNPISISSIPVEALETLQEWLSKSNILYYLNPQPYNWQMVMNEVRSKPLKQFLAEGGWSFLERAASDDEDGGKGGGGGGGGGEGSSEGGGSDDYEPEASESSESEFDEDDEDDDGDDDGDDEDDEEGSGSEEEEADDWDELDKKAEAHDRKKWGAESKKPAAPAQPDPKKRKT